MNLTDLLADKPMEAAARELADVPAGITLTRIERVIRAAWEAAELAQGQLPITSSAKAESEVLDSSCAVPREYFALVLGVLQESAEIICPTQSNFDDDMYLAIAQTKACLKDTAHSTPAGESAMREALEEIIREYKAHDTAGIDVMYQIAFDALHPTPAKERG
jgi:hypothetical protein